MDPGGIIHEDPIPNHHRQFTVRDAYLTLIDPKLAIIFGLIPCLERPPHSCKQLRRTLSQKDYEVKRKNRWNSLPFRPGGPDVIRKDRAGCPPRGLWVGLRFFFSPQKDD